MSACNQYFETNSKIGFQFKIKADSPFKPQAYMEYVEDLKGGSNADIGLEDIFDIGIKSLPSLLAQKPTAVRSLLPSQW